jgi:hypothetical protein
VIYWQPSGSGLTFDPGYQSLINTFFSDVAADSRRSTNVFGLTGQYSDSNGPAAYNSTDGGSVTATDPLPPDGCVEPLGPPAGDGPGWSRCVNDGQLETEIEHVVHADHLPSTGNDIYFLVMPDGLGSCEFNGPDFCALGGTTDGSYCGYHSSTPSGLLYAVIPYNGLAGHCQSNNPRPNTNAADPAISTLSHESVETITDPFTEQGWIDPSGNEIADLCYTEFGPALGGTGLSAYNEVIHGGRFYLQEVWSDEDGACEPRARPDRTSLTAPAHVHAHDLATFTGRASAAHGSIVAYNWFFGDHATAHSRHASHTFRRAGSYRVVLRTTDSSGNWTFDAVTVRVAPSRAGKPAARRR